MKRVTFTIAQLMAMPREAGYLDELAACAMAKTKTSMTFDTERECYRRLKEKYDRRADGQVVQRARQAARERLGQSPQQESTPVSSSPRSTGCRRCGGRQLSS